MFDIEKLGPYLLPPYVHWYIEEMKFSVCSIKINSTLRMVELIYHSGSKEYVAYDVIENAFHAAYSRR